MAIQLAGWGILRTMPNEIISQIPKSKHGVDFSLPEYKYLISYPNAKQTKQT
ncbi:hypothetical protein J2W30_002175 [Variovorax boronicumulans]|uniref:hypothetical protein n=1 Tax=Variovorax boronicumulans TaxID=436515 RepID=UPI00277F1DF4|nr:hypothetical protein [Variovorax boronicumulans]MDQ0034420.1 hypothetical protein [Variovorax boronicumulans]